jgi:hypothetical protein
LRIKSKIFYWYIALAILYAGLTLLTAPSKATLAKYHVTPDQLRLLNLTIIIPLVGIWFAGFYGYNKLANYATLIKRAEDGRQVHRLATGLLFLVIGLPISSIITQILTLLTNHNAGLTGLSVVIKTYVGLIFPLTAFITISNGARGLSVLAKKRPTYLASQILTLILIVGGVMYGYMMSNLHQTVGETYHMSLGLVLATVVIPYIYTWFIGLVAAYEIHIYARHVSGVVYRKSWDMLAWSFGSIILVSILLQYITNLTVRIQALSLTMVLLLVYVLLTLLSVGYILLAFGTKKLMKIEEV